MKHPSIKNILSGSFWGILSKLLDALAKFVTIPLLISYYGKLDFGLVALAFSLNTYLRLMDLGMNIGGVRFFSVWFAQKNTEKIINVSQSSVLVYGVIGIINALIFLVLGHFSSSFFNLNQEQAHVFEIMMYILAASAIINWTGYVIEQLLNAIEEFSWLSKMVVASSILSFLSVFVAMKFNLKLESYFFLYVLCSLIPVPFNIIRLARTKLSVKKLLKPKWHFADFKQVVRYSLAIFAMGIFQVSADTIRPVLLGTFAGKGIEVLADYRIAQTITLFVVSMGAVFFNMLIPLSSKTHAENDERRKDTIVYKGTKIISAFLSLIIFGLVINTAYILEIYVGKSYSHLTVWINLWLITLLISMHTFPVSSLILSGGRTKPLVWSSAIGCVASIG